MSDIYYFYLLIAADWLPRAFMTALFLAFIVGLLTRGIRSYD